MHRRTASQTPSMSSSRAMGHHRYPSSTHGPAPNKTVLLYLIDFLRPRKSRLRATFLCLSPPIVVTPYVCLVSPPALSPGHPYRSKLARLDDAWRKYALNS